MFPINRPVSRTFLIALALLLLVGCACSKEIRIATWNVRDALKPEDVLARRSDFQAAGAELKPDILLVQEVVSLKIAESIRDQMGLQGYFVACSDFSQSDKPFRANFEVAVISRYPFSKVIEYDPTPDNVKTEGDPLEEDLLPPSKIKIPDVATERGFLWVSIAQLKLNVSVVHLKSSLGQAGYKDRENAMKRELVAAAVAACVLQNATLSPDYTSVVGGDFNVGHSDPNKNGENLSVDSYSKKDGKDLYDETHALLAKGLVGGLKMKNLALSITDTTYPGFPGSPIDNIYVSDKRAGKFSEARKASKRFGSDHLAVWTVYSTP